MAEADIKWVKPVALVGGFAGLGKWVVYLVSKAIDAIYFNALRHVPGPKLNALSMIPYARHLLAGTTVENTVKLHEKYGEMVRISPNEVSFISAETAFPDIYGPYMTFAGFRTGKLKGHLNMAKDPVWYVKPENGAPAILQANDEDHSRGRRVLAHAFSERALMAQEPLLQRYVGQLVDGLKEVTSASNDAVDMVRWYNWTTFDVIADLMFGESFGCLQDLSTHKYVALLFESLTSLRMIYVLTYYPWLKYFGNFVIDNKILQKRKDYLAWISSQVKKRTERDTVRPDFMTHILANNGSKGTALSQKEIDSNAGLMITAGSETTATVLSGATWLLLTNPNVMQKVKDEIRSKFESYDDITLSRVNEIPYTIAFLSEALRLFPPIPVGFARRVAKGDAFVSGYFVPEGTLVSVSHFAAYHSAQNFKDPGAVVPERWLGDEMYAADKKSAFQPFSFGPRSCLGRNLALAEMRLILAKIVWSFDLELQPGSRDWLRRCRVMRLWQKPELAVRVKEVERS